VKMTTPVSH
jgi:hypothetical protein